MQKSQRYKIISSEPKVVEGLARLVERAALSCGLRIPDKIIGTTSRLPREARFDYSMMLDGHNVGSFKYLLENGFCRGELDLRSLPPALHNQLFGYLKRYSKILRPVS